MVAIPQKKAGMVLKPATRGRLGKNRSGTRLSCRFTQEKRRLRQNRRPSTLLGKFPAEPVYHGDPQEKRDRIGETIRIEETIRISKAARTRPTPFSKFRTTFVHS